jgi:hypothetical protein
MRVLARPESHIRRGQTSHAWHGPLATGTLRAEMLMPSGIPSAFSLSRQFGIALCVVLVLSGSALVLQPLHETGATTSAHLSAMSALAGSATGGGTVWNPGTRGVSGGRIALGIAGTPERPIAQIPSGGGAEAAATAAVRSASWPPKPRLKDIAPILAHRNSAESAPARAQQGLGGAPALVEVRAGVHADLERIVFDWPDMVGHEVTQQGDRLVVAFDRPARIDLTGLLERLGPRVIDAWTEDGDSTTRVWMRVGRGVGFRSFSLAGDRVVIDLVDAQGPPVGAPRRPESPSDEAIGELHEQLRRRDAQIAGLLARVEQLERRGLLVESDLDMVAAGGSGGSGPPLGPSPPAPAASEEAEQHHSAKAAGAQAAPGQFEVEEKEIDRALERTLVQTGVLLLPYGKAEIEPSFSYARWKVDTPTFVNENGTVFVGEQEVRRNDFQTAQSLRFGLPFDTQLELSLPYRYVDESTVTKVGFGERREADSSGSGYGDLTVGVAKTLLRENGGWWPDVVGRVRWDTDTGKSLSGDVPTGGGFNELAGSLSVVKRQDPLAFVGGVSYETTFEKDDIQPGDALGFSVGTILAASPDTSLRLGLDQRFVNEASVSGHSIDGSDQTIGTLSIGVASILGHGVLLNGAVDIGLTDDAPDYAVRASLPVQFDLPIY